MLIIQIALGIVAGYLLLRFLDSVVALVVIAIVLVIVLASAGGIFVFISDSQELQVLLALVAVVVACYVWMDRRLLKRSRELALEQLKERIRDRRGKGYDVTEEQQQLRAMEEVLSAGKRPPQRGA